MLQRVVVEPAQIQPPQILLTPDQQHYLSRVLRLRLGDRFVAMDGHGHSWLVSLEQGATAQMLEPVTVQTELPINITLVIALPKGNAFDEVVRQATELGVNCIVPVISDRTLLNPSPQKRERWQRIAQEAAEQSERQLAPTLFAPCAFADHLKHLNDSNSQNYLCVTRNVAPHLFSLLCPSPSSPPVLIAIGPEGGWTEAETEQAIAAGYQPVSLGSRILRAVTAPIFALSLIAAVYEQGNVTEGQR